MISFLKIQHDWRQAISLKKAIEDKIAKGEIMNTAVLGHICSD